MRRLADTYERPLMELEQFLSAAQRHLGGSDLELAARAIFHEISCLFERELQQAAYNSPDPTWHELAGDPEPTIGARLGPLVKRIEAGIGCPVNDLPGAATINAVRHVVNALKHRQGVKKFGGAEGGRIRLPSYHTVGPEDAQAAINDARRFFRELWLRVESDAL